MEQKCLEGHITVVGGQPSAISRMLMSIIIRMEQPTCFIDTAEFFDACCILKHHSAPDRLLGKIRIAHPLSLQDLHSLLEKFQDEKILIISSLDRILLKGFHLQDLKRTLSSLARITKKKNIITILGHEGHIPIEFLEEYIDSYAIL